MVLCCMDWRRETLVGNLGLRPLAELIDWLGQQRGRLWRRVVPAIALCLLVVVQAAGTLRTYPYYLSYYNPLLGGSRRAPSSTRSRSSAAW